MFSFLKNRQSIPFKPSLDDVDLDVANLSGAVKVVEDFPRIQWSLVRQAVSRYSDHPALDRIWTEVAAQWLGIIKRHLGGIYEIYEGRHILLLSAQTPFEARGLLELGDSAYERLDKLIQTSPASRGFGKHAVLAFETQATFYDYVSFFHSESDRRRGLAAGMHIANGYRHTALISKLQQTHRTLVHELAHNAVYDRPLPRWVNEGLAQFMEDMVPGFRTPILDARQVRLQRRYWSWFGMAHFWNGSGFLVSSSQHVSYQLSEILFRNLVAHRTRKRNLAKFLATADRSDAGQSACDECFGCSLGDLAGEFLGPGRWDPALIPLLKIFKSS